MSYRRSTRGEVGKRVSRTLQRLMLEPLPADAQPAEVFDPERPAKPAPGYPVEPMDTPHRPMGDAE